LPGAEFSVPFSSFFCQHRLLVPPFHQQLLDLLHERKPTPEPGLPAASALAAFALSADDARRLDQFAELSPLYRRFLLTRPLDLPWLLEPPPDERTANGEQAPDEWRRFRGDLKRSDADYLSRLRLFRRRMSMRIAWRDISAQHTVQRSVRELSALAELCIRECYEIALAGWKERWGEPWDDALGQPARFCVLALGKLGGRELNFSSDIDLIYFYEGDGQCRKGGQPGPSTSQRFFTKVAETFTHHLQGQTEHGFLFRVDLRLRPEGGRSALVRSFAGMENYCAAAGQSWERLALIKARPVAGALALGGELLESLHS